MIFSGIYLLFYKRKMTSGIQLTDWLDKLDLSPSAKSVRLKEINKQAEKIFTRKWFLEYWQGERTALSAWLTWIFLGGIIMRVVLMLSLLKIAEHWFLVVLLIIVFMYKILSSIILWRCAKNSTPINKYFARTIAVLNVLTNFIR